MEQKMKQNRKENGPEPEPERSASDYEYNTLMRLLGVSVSKHLLNRHFTLIWANDLYYDLIGWPREEYEAVYHNRCDLYYQNGDEEEWDRLTATVIDAIAKGESGYSLVSPIRRKNGDYVWVKFSTAFADEYVDGVQVAYTVLTNIDDLVRMQKEQSITYENLPGFVARFRVEEDGLHFLEANGRFRKFFELDGQVKLSCGLTNLDTESNRAHFRKYFPKMRKGEPVHFTLQAKARDGGDLWLQVNGDCMEWVNGDPVYLLIYIDITDITEQRELQKQLEERSDMLRDALEAAEKANRAKSEFLSRMSHDIRTPMNAIMGMTAIASTHLDDKERVQDCLAKIDVSSRLLLSLINEVLDMSKIESGRITMGEEAFNIGDVIRNVVTIIQPSIMEKRHVFDIHAFGIRHESVIGDPRRMEQVFLNILSNAVKYTPEKGRLVMDLRETDSDREGFGRYEFSFRDNGFGMKPEFLEKIFIPFERAGDSAVSEIQGTGLGMSISQNIVHMMGGEIRVESSYGEGSAFTVTIYLKLQDVQTEEPELKTSLPVLVVDDDRTACETTCGRLEELGIAGQWVLSGREAVEKAADHSYFAILVDMKMPNMDGIETARLIRERVGDKIPIILLSAYDWTEFEEAAKAAGINGFVAKPMLKSTLIYALRRYALQEETGAHRADFFSRPGGSYAGKRLLLVEDNDLNREIAVEILGQTGAAIETAADGLEAVEKFAASPAEYYSLIFMDLQMPVMGGIEAACRIRGLKRKDASAVPIIAMTANVFAEDVAESRAAGMNDHLAKPLEFDRIWQVMEKYMKE